MNVPWNPLRALGKPQIYDLFLKMVTHRYRTDILIDYYRLSGIPTYFTYFGKKITPLQKAQCELEFLKKRANKNDPEEVVEEFWDRIAPKNDHLRDHLQTEDKFNEDITNEENMMHKNILDDNNKIIIHNSSNSKSYKEITPFTLASKYCKRCVQLLNKYTTCNN